MTGFRTLFYKELLRFWKVATQTLTAPIVTAMLYLIMTSICTSEPTQSIVHWRFITVIVEASDGDVWRLNIKQGVSLNELFLLKTSFFN